MRNGLLRDIGLLLLPKIPPELLEEELLPPLIELINIEKTQMSKIRTRAPMTMSQNTDNFFDELLFT